MSSLKRGEKVDYVDIVKRFWRINRVKYVKVKNAEKKRKTVAIGSINVVISVMDTKGKNNVWNANIKTAI